MGIITICSLSCAAYLGFVTLRQESNNLAIQELGLKLDIEPNWSAFDKYVLDKLEKGTPREKVHQELAKIGPYEIEPRPSGDCDIVQFKMGLLKRVKNPKPPTSNPKSKI